MTSRLFARPQFVLLVLGLLLPTVIVLKSPVIAQDAQQRTRLESDAALVTARGHWQSQTTSAASGGRYLYSTRAEDNLTLYFQGPYIDVIYVAHPAFGTLALEIDGQVWRTVNTTADETRFDQHATIDYLDDGPHVLRVYAVSGMVALDAFEAIPRPPDELAPRAFCEISTMVRISKSASFVQANGASQRPAISADGRYIVFSSLATNLIPVDTNNREDVFVFDRELCTVTRVSVSASNVQANGTSLRPSISADGKRIVYQSDATNLIDGTTLTSRTRIYVYDLTFGDPEVSVVSVSTAGVDANNNSSEPVISADGRYVVFLSLATNLVSGSDTNGANDVFLRDLLWEETERMSVNDAGSGANAGSTAPAISANDNIVVFASTATNLVTGGGSLSSIYVRIRDQELTERISNPFNPADGVPNGASFDPEISDDGRYVIFRSSASNLIQLDLNNVEDVFIVDRNTDTTTRVNVDQAGDPVTLAATDPDLSADGRYVTFATQAALVTTDSNNQVDIYIRDLQTSTNYVASQPAASLPAPGR